MRRFWMSAVLMIGTLLSATEVAHGAVPDAVGLFDPATGRWHLLDEAGRTATFTYGNPGDVPFTGDWDCDGVDTPGLYRPSDGLVYLRNSATSGAADVEYHFGNPGDMPLAGDFDGDGCDTVSLYRSGEAQVYVINRLGSRRAGLGPADQVHTFGNPGDVPFAGDFDGDGVDTVGVYRPGSGRVHLRNGTGAGAADVSFTFGDPGDRFVTGDWTGDGADTAGVFRSGDRTFHLRHRNAAGAADRSIVMGRRHMVPISGRFDLGDRARFVDWRSFTLAFTGDVLIHQAVSRAAMTAMGGYDFRPMFAAIRPIIEEADVAICHLEAPLSSDSTGLSDYPLFNTPREVADGVGWAGFEGCSTASNHSFDQGPTGIGATLDALDAAGVGHAGTARSSAEAEAITTYRVLDGVTVAHLAYTWWLNGLRLPAATPWLVNLLDPADIVADAARARAGGADVVVVSIHWGDEYRMWPSALQLSVATAVTASPDVDLVVGHHAHVVQPVDYVNGKYVAYGLGNFLSAQVTTPRRDGVVLFLELVADGARWQVEEVRYQPTFVASGYRIVPASGASEQRTAATLRVLGAPNLVAR